MFLWLQGRRGDSDADSLFDDEDDDSEDFYSLLWNKYGDEWFSS